MERVSVRRSVLWAQTRGAGKRGGRNGTFKRLPGRRVGTVRAKSDSRLGEARSRTPGGGAGGCHVNLGVRRSYSQLARLPLAGRLRQAMLNSLLRRSQGIPNGATLPGDPLGGSASVQKRGVILVSNADRRSTGTSA
jgi:hypothetical protein